MIWGGGLIVIIAYASRGVAHVIPLSVLLLVDDNTPLLLMDGGELILMDN